MGATVRIDTSDAVHKMRALSTALSPNEMKQLERRVMLRSGRKVKTIVKKEVPKEYHVTSGIVGKDIKAMRMGSAGVGAGDVSCTIPIEGKRHIIGGKTFPARGGRHGWKGVFTGKRYKITAQILRGQSSTLPTAIGNQDDHAPFRNYDASRLNNATFVRRPSAGMPPRNKPISRVVGIAVPQMPMNRAEHAVQEEIGDFMQKRVEAEFNFIISRCR
ncbi:MAG: hypothetical protein ACI4PG_06505 [Candidatus Ventricola sp.]